MDFRQELEAQVALGTYHRWWLKIRTRSSFEDPPQLQNILKISLPFYEVWSEGSYLVYGTYAHIEQCVDLIRQIPNPTREKGFDFHMQDAGPQYASFDITLEKEEDGQIKKVRV